MSRRDALILLTGAGALALVGCNIQPEAFANGTSKTAGPLTTTLNLEPNPPRVGQDVNFRFSIRDQKGPVPPDGLTGELSVDMPKMPMTLPTIPLESSGDGRWDARYRFTMAGRWTATLRVTPKNGTAAEATFAFDVGP